MELIGRGVWGKGVIFVAMRVPEGYIAAHANQARITQFLDACKDPSVCLASSDVIQFAIDRGYYQGTVNDPSFSFSDTYDPVTVNGARFCEARVWYIFANLADPADFNPAQYLDYAQGFNLTNRMPLFVRGKLEKISRNDVHDMLSSRFEGSWFDPASDVGAGAEHSPYRWNGLQWTSSNGTQYLNERIVGTQSTAWHFVAVVDPSLPAAMRALSYFGVDDHAWSPKIPLFGGAVAVHRSYDDGNCSARVACRQEFGLPGYMMEFTWDAAFWVNTAVAKMVYAEKDRASPIVSQARCEFEQFLSPLVTSTKLKATALFDAGDVEGGASALTDLAMTTGAEATLRWIKLWQQLLVTNADGYVASGTGICVELVYWWLCD
jgi:dipeptidase